MRRLKYASVFSRDLTPSELQDIADVSSRNNEAAGITGVMLAAGNVFFQILEGPDDQVGALFDKIAADDRHENILLLRDARGAEGRLFPRWSMKLVELDRANSSRLEMLEGAIETVRIQMQAVEKLASVIEQTIWREYGQSDEDE
jgi:hypothetical protein